MNLISLPTLIPILIILISRVNGSYFPWMYYLPYGEDVILKPLFQNKSENLVIKSCKWTTPKQIVLDADLINYDTNRYYIDKSDCELSIFNIQKDTNGIYHCTINDFLISKAMLNVHGAPKASLIEEYAPNLIAGFSTAGGIIAFFAFTCGIYKFRYKELPTDTTRNKNIEASINEASSEINTNNIEYNNESYVGDEEIKTKDDDGSIRL